MRVGFIGNVPPPIGGAEVLLRRFLTHFVRHGHRGVLVRWRKQILLYFPERLVREYAPRGAIRRVSGLPAHYVLEAIGPRRGESDAAFDRRLAAHYERQAEEATARLRRARVELVQAHMLHPNAFFAVTAARALSVPCVVSIHGMLEFRLMEHFGRRYPRATGLVKRSLRRATCVVGVSREVARACRARGARPVMQIPSGVDTRAFRPPADPPEARDIVFLGSVREEKGAPLLLEAYERLNGLVAGDLVLIGRPLLSPRLAARAQRHPRIHLLGEQPAAVVRRRLARAKLVVLPSASEGLPLSVLEAMAMAKPVLVTKTGELARLIRDGRTGLFIRRRSAPALAAQIKALAGRRDLPRIGRAARRAVARLDIRTVVRRYEALYRSLIGPR